MEATAIHTQRIDYRRIAARVLTILLALMCVVPAAPAYAKSPTLAIDSNTVGMTKAERKVYKTLKSYKSKAAYREGKRWGDDKHYLYKGNRYYEYKGYWFNGGYGCHAFALKMSDLAFGTKKPLKTHRKWSKIRVGDVVRMNEFTNKAHTVIVLKVVGKKYVVAEGNFNGRVHWGRVITRSEFSKTGSFVLTRY